MGLIFNTKTQRHKEEKKNKTGKVDFIAYLSNTFMIFLKDTGLNLKEIVWRNSLTFHDDLQTLIFR